MRMLAGKVVNGRIEVGDVELPEGAEVEVYIYSIAGMKLTAEELDDLDKAIGEADRGEGVSADEVLREVRLMREAETAHRR